MIKKLFSTALSVTAALYQPTMAAQDMLTPQEVRPKERNSVAMSDPELSKEIDALFNTFKRRKLEGASHLCLQAAYLGHPEAIALQVKASTILGERDRVHFWHQQQKADEGDLEAIAYMIAAHKQNEGEKDTFKEGKPNSLSELECLEWCRRSPWFWSQKASEEAALNLAKIYEQEAEIYSQQATALKEATPFTDDAWRQSNFLEENSRNKYKKILECLKGRETSKNEEVQKILIRAYLKIDPFLKTINQTLNQTLRYEIGKTYIGSSDRHTFDWGKLDQAFQCLEGAENSDDLEAKKALAKAYVFLGDKTPPVTTDQAFRFELGKAYSHARGNQEKVLEYLEGAENSDDLEAKSALAKAYVYLGDKTPPVTTDQVFRFELGKAYLQAYGSPQDNEEKVLEYLNGAENNNDLEAKKSLAKAYAFFGKTLPETADQTFRLELGKAYSHAPGDQEDNEKKVLEYLKGAENSDDLETRIALAKAYLFLRETPPATAGQAFRFECAKLILQGVGIRITTAPDGSVKWEKSHYSRINEEVLATCLLYLEGATESQDKEAAAELLWAYEKIKNEYCYNKEVFAHQMPQEMSYTKARFELAKYCIAERYMCARNLALMLIEGIKWEDTGNNPEASRLEFGKIYARSLEKCYSHQDWENILHYLKGAENSNDLEAKRALAKAYGELDITPPETKDQTPRFEFGKESMHSWSWRGKFAPVNTLLYFEGAEESNDKETIEALTATYAKIESLFFPNQIPPERSYTKFKSELGKRLATDDYKYESDRFITILKLLSGPKMTDGQETTNLLANLFFKGHEYSDVTGEFPIDQVNSPKIKLEIAKLFLSEAARYNFPPYFDKYCEKAIKCLKGLEIEFDEDLIKDLANHIFINREKLLSYTDLKDFLWNSQKFSFEMEKAYSMNKDIEKAREPLKNTEISSDDEDEEVLSKFQNAFKAFKGNFSNLLG